KSRIFKVLKTLVPHEVQPPPLNSLLGYEFYRVDAATGKPNEFRIEFGPEARQSYLAKLYDLAYEIAEFLKSLGPGAAGRARAATPYLDAPWPCAKGQAPAELRRAYRK